MCVCLGENLGKYFYGNPVILLVSPCETMKNKCIFYYVVKTLGWASNISLSYSTYLVVIYYYTLDQRITISTSVTLHLVYHFSKYGTGG